MPSSFDTTWTSGPAGPAPLLWMLSQTDAGSERNYILSSKPILGGAGVFQLAGALVQYSSNSGAMPTSEPIFRRRGGRRAGSRGVPQ